MSWIAGILSGMAGALGVGGGGVLMIYLTAIISTPQLRAQGINLIFFIPCAITALIIHIIKKRVSFRLLLPMLLGGLPGVCLGTWLASYIGGALLSKIFAVFLILLGVKEVFFTASHKND